MQPGTKKALVEVTLFAVSNVAALYVLKYMWSAMDPNRAKSDEAKTRSKKVLGRLGVSAKELSLSEHESIIAAEVINPEDIPSNFTDIGGLDPIIDQLKEAVIFPLCYPELFRSAAGLFGAPKGVLLYGPPGCGKTLLAKALAKESGATFINIKASTLQSKWYGEGVRLVDALFSVARKLQPSIIFIDEIDSFLRERSGMDHEVSSTMKAEFMSSWDGLLSNNDMRILVLGATNRPNDIDQAILRRMPKRFAIKLPNSAQRRSILHLMLRDIDLEKNFDFDALVRRTDGLSGSDLKEACRNAAMIPVREVMREKSGQGPEALERAKLEGFTIRPLRQKDFLQSDYATPSSSIDVDTLD